MTRGGEFSLLDSASRSGGAHDFGRSPSDELKRPDYKFGDRPEHMEGDPSEKSGPEVKVDVVEVSGEATKWEASKSWEDHHGPVEVKAAGGVTAGKVEAHAGAGFSKDGAHVDVGARGTLLSADSELSAEYGYAEAGVQSEAFAGGEVNLDASIGKDGVHAGGEAFAGGKVELNATADVGGVGGTFTAEGWGGFGAAADFDAGYEDGRIKVGGEVGLGFGLGGKLGSGIEIDVAEVTDTAGDVVVAVGGWLD
jgi:hypothetical protein